MGKSKERLVLFSKQLFGRCRNEIKHVFYFLVYYSGVLYFSILLWKKVRKKHEVVILFYHRFIKGENGENILPYLDIKEFKKQVAHLNRFYTFISMEDVVRTLKEDGKFGQPSVLLTIDDGYLSNYVLAYPILQKYKIPAIIYLTAGLIGTWKALWVDDIEFALNNSGVTLFLLRELFGDEIMDITTFEKKKKVEKRLFTTMRKMDTVRREYLINRLFEILRLDPSELKKRARTMLNWEEVAEMAKNGVSFGAHTLSHAFLPVLAGEIAKTEIRESKEIIEKRIGKPIRHFAIPNGKSEDFTEELLEFCGNIGFDTIVTTESGVVNSTSSLFSLKRVPPSTPLYCFACEIAKYLMFCKRG